MEMFVLWEAPISMKVEWRCASMSSGGQCVMTAGILLMPLWFASSWDMHILEVSVNAVWMWVRSFILLSYSSCGTGGIPYSNAFFGAGTGPIYLDDVVCTSSSSQLLECSSSPVLTHNCDHRADAGVGCEGMFSYLLMNTNSTTRAEHIVLLFQLHAEPVNCV